jgi:hypothetical protein
MIGFPGPNRQGRPDGPSVEMAAAPIHQTSEDDPERRGDAVLRRFPTLEGEESGGEDGR